MKVHEFSKKAGLSIDEAIALLKEKTEHSIIDGFSEVNDFVAKGLLVEIGPENHMRARRESRMFEMELNHFKAFKDARNIKQKPITLVFGPNSSGKSSLLHSLLFFNQVMTENELDFRHPKLTGNSVDLGGYRNLVYGKDPDSNPIRYEFGFKTSEFNEDHTEYIPIRCEIVYSDVSDTLEAKYQNLSGLLDPESEPTRKVPDGPHASRLSVTIGDETLLQIRQFQGNFFKFDQFNLDHPVFQDHLKHIAESISWNPGKDDTTISILKNYIELIFDKYGISWFGYLPYYDETSSDPFNYPFGNPTVQFDGSEESPEPFIQDAMESRLSDITASLNTFLAKIFKILHLHLKPIEGMAYLGPIRTIPDRYFAFGFEKNGEWHASGGEAWDILKEEKDIREKVNKWLGNEKFLKTPYKLQKRVFHSLADIKEEIELGFHRVNNELSGDYEEDASDLLERIKGTYAIDTEEYTRDLLRDILSNASVTHFDDLLLRDVKQGITVGHRDVGVGITQILPVLAYSMAFRNRLICIEQPEIHIHPALQAELGDVFIETALGENQNSFILETHSEHLILRILRRIRECSEGDADYPENLPKIRPEDVSVLYVEPGAEGSTITELPITSDGDFSVQWPDGFFTERAKELF
jgi:hypothetical protein